MACTPNLVCHLEAPSAPTCQSLPRAIAIISPLGLTFAQQIGMPQLRVLILFFASQSQKCIPPSDPAVMNHFSLTGLKPTELIGQRIVLPPSSCLLLLKVMMDFGWYNPLTFLEMLLRLALPSNDATPNTEVLLLMAIDWICEFLPRSFESTIDLLLELFMSTNIIFSPAIPATIIGNWKSLVKILFSALMLSTGFWFPGCQKWMLFQQPVDTMMF